MPNSTWSSVRTPSRLGNRDGVLTDGVYCSRSAIRDFFAIGIGQREMKASFAVTKRDRRPRLGPRLVPFASVMASVPARVRNPTSRMHDERHRARLGEEYACGSMAISHFKFWTLVPADCVCAWEAIAGPLALLANRSKIGNDVPNQHQSLCPQLCSAVEAKGR